MPQNFPWYDPQDEYRKAIGVVSALQNLKLQKEQREMQRQQIAAMRELRMAQAQEIADKRAAADRMEAEKGFKENMELVSQGHQLYNVPGVIKTLGTPFGAVAKPGGGYVAPRMESQVQKAKTDEEIRKQVSIKKATEEGKASDLYDVTITNEGLAEAFGKPVGSTVSIPKGGFAAFMKMAAGKSGAGLEPSDIFIDEMETTDGEGNVVKQAIGRNKVTGEELWRSNQGSPFKKSEQKKLTNQDLNRIKLGMDEVDFLKNKTDIPIAERKRLAWQKAQEIQATLDDDEKVEIGRDKEGWAFVKPNQSYGGKGKAQSPATTSGSSPRDAKSAAQARLQRKVAEINASGLTPEQKAAEVQRVQGVFAKYFGQ